MQTVILFLCALLGMLFHSAMKLNSLKAQSKAANLTFSLKGYLVEDAFALIASFISIFVWLLLFGEISKQYPGLVDYARLSFVMMGASGSYLIQYFLSQAEKRITDVIDKKTNIADNKTLTP